VLVLVVVVPFFMKDLPFLILKVFKDLDPEYKSQGRIF
jgi:hypothetical protein